MSNKKVGQDFLCGITYRNALPPLPFEAKLLSRDLNARRRELCQDVLGTPSAENTTHITAAVDVAAAHADNGMPVHPLRMGFVFAPPVPSTDPIDPLDAALLVPYAPPQPKKPIQPTSVSTATSGTRNASWLRRTEYIAADLVQKKVDVNARIAKKVQDKSHDKSPSKKYQNMAPHDEILARIQHTFEAAAKQNVASLKHPTNPKLTATELLPVFPDYEHWPFEYVSVVFDSDPLTSTGNANDEMDERSKMEHEESLLRYQRNPADETDACLSYYAPAPETVETLMRRKLDDDDEEDQVDDANETDAQELDFKLVRDFTYKEKALGPENSMIFLNISDEVAIYHRLAGRVDLVRKRALAKTYFNRYDDTDFEKPTLYKVSKRSRNKRERRVKLGKMREILPLEHEASGTADGEEDVDMSDLDDEEEEDDSYVQAARNGQSLKQNYVAGAGLSSGGLNGDGAEPSRVRTLDDLSASDSDDSDVGMRVDPSDSANAPVYNTVVDADGDAEW
ncbi:RNA polymerase-associated factor [Chytriomyces hyalinus]|nr:RNA polymerase-associated factor [Chytriomyces hyalinus]